MIYKFSVLELKTLLKGSGYHSLPGIDLGDEALENEAVMNTLNKMNNEKMIFSNGESFILCDDIREIIEVIGKSEEYFALHTLNDQLPDLCIYSSSDTLILVSQRGNPSFVIVETTDIPGLFDKLFNEGYLTFRDCFVLPSIGDLEEYEEELFLDLDPNAPINKASLLFTIEKNDIKKNLLKYLRIVDYYFSTYISVYDGKVKTRYVYSKDKIKECIKEIIK